LGCGAYSALPHPKIWTSPRGIPRELNLVVDELDSFAPGRDEMTLW